MDQDTCSFVTMLEIWKSAESFTKWQLGKNSTLILCNKEPFERKYFFQLTNALLKSYITTGTGTYFFKNLDQGTVFQKKWIRKAIKNWSGNNTLTRPTWGRKLRECSRAGADGGQPPDHHPRCYPARSTPTLVFYLVERDISVSYFLPQMWILS